MPAARASGQLAGAGARMRVEHARSVRGLDRFERRRRARVDLERPRALAVPDEVDAEQPAEAERGRHAGADRARLLQQLGRRHARRDDVPAPAVATDAERAPPDELLGEPEHDGVRRVAHRRRGTRDSVDALLQEGPGLRRAAAPLLHADPAAAAQRLAQPAAGGRRHVRRSAGTGGRPARRRAGRDRGRRAASPASCPAACAAPPAGRRARGGSRSSRRRRRRPAAPPPPRRRARSGHRP